MWKDVSRERPLDQSAAVAVLKLLAGAARAGLIAAGELVLHNGLREAGAREGGECLGV